VGKSTALFVAGSVWGSGGVRGYVRQWRATNNGLEAVCAAHCDTLLALDELSQIEPRAAGAAAYMLANGVGKTRMTKNASARPPAEWRLLFLSSGEIGLADKIAEDRFARRSIAAGQEVRVLEIPADAGAGHKLFESLHGFENGDLFARHLRHVTEEYYGAAARAWLAAIVDDIDTISTEVSEQRARFVERVCPQDANGQVRRAAARFGLIAAAGELAVAAEVLPWPQGEATTGVAKCFQAWLAARGSSGSSEIETGIRQVLTAVQAHGSSRFEEAWTLETIRVSIRDRLGFRRPDGPNGEWTYYFTSSGWQEVCVGRDRQAIAREMISRGMLEPGGDGKSAVSLNVPSAGKLRLYHVLPSAMESVHE
jgi:putative DNA primase/helicase